MPVRIVHVVGAPPNYMKIAPMRELAEADGAFEQFLVNTGRNYDRSLSDVFVDELGLPPNRQWKGFGA